MTQTSHDTCAAFVGIDWADAKHDLCLQAAGTAKRACFQLAHTPEAIEAWVTTLRTRFSAQPIAICLELTKAPMVSAFRKDDFLPLFPINPLTLARYRQALTPSRAKDDLTDAEGQLELLLTHKATSVGLPALAGRGKELTSEGSMPDGVTIIDKLDEPSMGESSFKGRLPPLEAVVKMSQASRFSNKRIMLI